MKSVEAKKKVAHARTRTHTHADTHTHTVDRLLFTVKLLYSPYCGSEGSGGGPGGGGGGLLRRDL